MNIESADICGVQYRVNSAEILFHQKHKAKEFLFEGRYWASRIMWATYARFDDRIDLSLVSDTRHKREKICWYCSSPVQLSRCAGCRIDWYCGEVCQRDDWDVHGEWCEKRGRKRKEKYEKLI